MLAARGEHEEALSHAREAVTIRAETDAPTLQADAHRVLGAVLRAGGHHDAANEALDAARERYLRKGDITSVAAIDRELPVSSP